ncbi:glycerol kinase GlpK [Halanaerobium sp. Z-7514]|uniref:Glycerol kinase GlpK n=1 Tax=Halanaerobium polyolivorans TaxID=2886943 RepID=A0AAW4X1E7_9FIRM|nr:glycerol kinase [Halanaerobium polyolivorans]MCC3145618.1 glycerol kinase GlpK [Halanaerobium polyolivorans]RQD73744.1 MAG: glycerol kinase GlpK [Halanaerobium sp. MSAO_Bac5]
MKKYVLVIDEGTTGTRSLIFDKEFNIVAQSYQEFTQYTPEENMVEHDAEEIYQKSLENCKKAMAEADISADQIDSIGITNQRATCVLWDKNTGKPIHKAIVWQDSRTAKECEELKNSEWGEKARQKTGWEVAPVYSSMMIQWLLENKPEVKKEVETGDILFGTMDTWLIWKLTGGKKHAISYSNASVTGSLNLETNQWYEEFLDYLGVPVSIYPEIINDSGDFGQTDPEIFGTAIPIRSSIADQHAALFAQECRTAGTAKITNGTGSFVDINIGNQCVVPGAGLNTVIAWKIGDTTTYAVEGYAGTTGSAIQWLKEGLEIIDDAAETEAMAESVADSNGVYFVPALTGLNAPFWDSFARGTIIGISRGAKKEHIVRATLEAIAFRIKDICDVVENKAKIDMEMVRIDGGVSKNNFLAQRIADILDAQVDRPGSIEATSLGAAQMAGLYTGFWKQEELENAVDMESTFKPKLDSKKRKEEYFKWRRAVDRAARWLDFDLEDI